VPLSRNLGILTSWNPVGHFRPVMGLLYLLYTLFSFTVIIIVRSEDTLCVTFFIIQ
jgi:hypothetical protein